ncbi:arfGTPase-activating protein [Naegleria gruberi]|uniref:ArfGTPase-activating protein n=1 Tax=Naegleria gruberi TaxID=5762 RepID=D2VUG6_NAEGR|nr:arfGTPase-activating protein [Naegleria gruberi]EFC39444.1 arfGTPase-activating protein [Naegleria gruberi]|eukprot:XP_002672188.1 arfGTPase-activating protein [Naegleria gruberi strain NEG-M]
MSSLLTSKQISQLVSLPGNNKCADCQAPNPRFADIKQFTLSCISCAGIKRTKIGTHVCQLRVVGLDTWKEEHFNAMIEQGGNDAVNRILEAELKDQDRKEEMKDMTRFIRAKYEEMRWKGCKALNEVFMKSYWCNLKELLERNGAVGSIEIVLKSVNSNDCVRVKQGQKMYEINLRDFTMEQIENSTDSSIELSLNSYQSIDKPIYQAMIDQSDEISIFSNGRGFFKRSGTRLFDFNLENDFILQIISTINGIFVIDRNLKVYKYYFLKICENEKFTNGITLQKCERDETPCGLTYFKSFISRIYPNLYKFIENDNLLTNEEIGTLNIIFNMLLYDNYDINGIDLFSLACIINNSTPDLDFFMEKLEFLTFKDMNGIQTVIEKVKNYIGENSTRSVSFLKLYLFKCLQFISNYGNVNNIKIYLPFNYSLKPKSKENLTCLFNCQKSSDITIKIENELFYLHRTVLTSKSSVFKIILDENSKFNDVKNNILEIDCEIFKNSKNGNVPNLMVKCFTILFNYFYDFEIDLSKFNFYLMSTLLEMSQFYQLDQFHDKINNELKFFRF